LTEKELNGGKYEGNQKQVAEILNAARKLATDKD